MHCFTACHAPSFLDIDGNSRLLRLSVYEPEQQHSDRYGARVSGDGPFPLRIDTLLSPCINLAAKGRSHQGPQTAHTKYLYIVRLQGSKNIVGC